MTLSEEQLAFVLQEGMVPQQQVNTCVKGVVGGRCSNTGVIGVVGGGGWDKKLAHGDIQHIQ